MHMLPQEQQVWNGQAPTPLTTRRRSGARCNGWGRDTIVLGVSGAWGGHSHLWSDHMLTCEKASKTDPLGARYFPMGARAF